MNVVGVLLPLALVLIMFYLGLTLQLTDFRQVLRRPRALAVGLAGQLLLLPLAGYAVARGAALEPTMAVGLMVLAACPGGVSSGLLTHLARGDVALSIALTALTSVASMVSMPLVVDAALRLFAQGSLPVELPLGATVRRMFLLTTLPVAVGMALRAWRREAVVRLEPFAGRVATALFVLIVLATFWSQRDVLFAHLGSVGPACAALNALVLAASWGLARGAGLARRDRIAVATECGLQNSALGIYVTLELLRQPALSVPSVVYALLMNVGALLFVVLVRRRGAVGNGACPRAVA
jgi:bile acid:Na+ symporter, BASS family